MSTVVYKLGGSLLSDSRFPDRLAALLKSRRDQHPLLIVGGGRTADLVRGWDTVFNIGEQRAHWLALEAMSLNERLVAAVYKSAQVVDDAATAENVWREGGLPILCAARYLAAAESSGQSTIPHTWNATSDTIAAWVAQTWPADRLVLLKSINKPTDDLGVDPYFTDHSRGIAVEWVNLRK